MKIDVAINAYKKPESLLYTLLSLKKSDSQQLIDTVYINDDFSNDGSIEYYLNEGFLKAMQPIQIKLRVNKKNTGYSRKIVTPSIFLAQLNNFRLTKINYKQIRKHGFYRKDDIRYQWAINHTNKNYLLIIHDDILFKDDVCALYLETIRKIDNCAIVGDLGQCWVCKEKELADCTPAKLTQGIYPNKYFPLTTSDAGALPIFFERRCRINEWCCMINIELTRNIKYHYFGNYEEKGDVAAYWFSEVIRRGYAFSEPLPTQKQRYQYYQHCWQGHTGHAVWLFQKSDANNHLYNRELIIKKLKADFGFDILKTSS